MVTAILNCLQEESPQVLPDIALAGSQSSPDCSVSRRAKAGMAACIVAAKRHAADL